MKICGFNKTTLLDYPGRVACTIFLGGCNFRCPFCQNGALVVEPDTQPEYSQEEILAFLKKRKGILDGVCISGGEPTLAPEPHHHAPSAGTAGAHRADLPRLHHQCGHEVPQVKSVILSSRNVCERSGSSFYRKA